MFSNYFIDNIYIVSIIICIFYIYLVFTFFWLLNIFDSRFLKSLSDFKKIGVTFPFNLMFLTTVFSFAGVPPLFGFSLKLILFLTLIKSGSFILVCILSCFNFFTLYFYIQNVRYLVNNNSNTYYVFINNHVHIGEFNMFLLISSLTINFVGVLYLSDLFIYFSLISV